VINFRYHVVSIAAVFLALALGLVVGTAAFNGPAADSLAAQVDSMGKANQKLRDEVNHLNDEAEQEEQFATETLPWAIGTRLAGKRVLIITTTDADKDYIDGVAEALENVVGAKITGRVSIQKRFVDPASKEELLDIVDKGTPKDVTGLPANSNGTETAAALLAAVLVDHTPRIEPDPRNTTLTALTGSYIVGSSVKDTAEAVLVLAGAPYNEKDANKLNAGLKTVVEQFDKAGPVVVGAESTAGDGNLVAAVRGDSNLKTASTVDNAGSPQGRVALLMALADQIEGKPAGSYGVSGQNGLVPKAPTVAKNGS
jgi:hypothetical protein